ncbi:uncharacterized protein STEHIDRAFT_146906 [Stereum hirsutum FP-91666 SS1]|uniref:uncharacterized protein n=1 Tax=Stereum hirsutum (strain FP-91666) TaxID=721885 RepID=UPI000440C058|nr:uncharacterized protein STEHIDRAFT_146906 [Stereum hirsutum FP-91666 SS1]EIM87567.1 hypothetical protein STEHIDRAFT_146906 [Stereum hirsutum FP-91666 SS1]
MMSSSTMNFTPYNNTKPKTFDKQSKSGVNAVEPREYSFLDRRDWSDAEVEHIINRKLSPVQSQALDDLLECIDPSSDTDNENNSDTDTDSIPSDSDGQSSRRPRCPGSCQPSERTRTKQTTSSTSASCDSVGL